MFVPNTRVSLLSSPSKMPSKSFGITAIVSCPSATFGKGAICGDSKDNPTCYAMRGAYAWRTVRNAYDKRFEYVKRAAVDAATGDEFVAIMVEAIDKEAARQERKHYREITTGAREYSEFSGPVFRLHDSGDLFSPEYCKLWTRIAASMPDVKFWVPSRQHKSKNLNMLAALYEFAALPNVALRPSALYINGTPPVINGWAAGTSASATDYNCPASSQGNACVDCRKCWTRDEPVIYRMH